MISKILDRLGLPVLVISAIGIVGYASVTTHSAQGSHTAKLPQPILVAGASQKDLLASTPIPEANSDASYHIVEFMDYQCPPCRMTYSRIPKEIAKLNGKASFTVRQCPLPMHEFAYPASLAAEAANAQGKFWSMHHALFESTDLSSGAITKIATSNGLDLKRFARDEKSIAPGEVKADQIARAKLGLTGTPTFYLSGPDGSVWKLGDISQASGLIR